MPRLLGFALLAALAACSKYEDVDGGGGHGGTAGGPATGGTGGGDSVAGGGGHGGTAGGPAIGGADGGNSCFVSPDVLRTISASGTRGPNVTTDAYSGPAVVETSDADQLVLAFQQEATGGTVVTSHSRITSNLPLPVFPVGAHVWLAQDPLAHPFVFWPWQQTLVVREHEGGRLLLGARRDTLPPFDDPVAVRNVTDGCSEPNKDQCFPGSTLVHENVEIAGDVVVTIADRQPGTVSIDGVVYDVGVIAERVVDGTYGNCADAFRPSGISVWVIAHDPAPIIAGLDRDAGCPCIE